MWDFLRLLTVLYHDPIPGLNANLDWLSRQGVPLQLIQLQHAYIIWLVCHPLLVDHCYRLLPMKTWMPLLQEVTDKVTVHMLIYHPRLSTLIVTKCIDNSQQARCVRPVAAQCWASDADAGPALNQHRVSINYYFFLYGNDCVMGNVRVYHGYFFQSIHITYLSVSCLSRLN